MMKLLHLIKRQSLFQKVKLYYANSLQWTGQNRTLIVEGTLIIKGF